MREAALKMSFSFGTIGYHLTHYAGLKPSMLQLSDDDDAGEFTGHEAPTTIVASEPGGRRREATLTTVPLAIIMFYSTSGGPFGVEGARKLVAVY